MADLGAWPLLAGLSTAMAGVGGTALERWARYLSPGKDCTVADIRYKVWAGGGLMGDGSPPVGASLDGYGSADYSSQPWSTHNGLCGARVHIGKRMLTPGSQLAFPPSSSWLQGYVLGGLRSLLRPPDEKPG